MPQLDFFAIQSQIICLFFSIIVLYILILKYALPAYDVYLRLKIKKINLWKLNLEILSYLSLIFKNNTYNFIQIFYTNILDLNKISSNLITTYLPLLYLISLEKKNVMINNFNFVKIISKISSRNIEITSNKLNRKILSQNKIINFYNKNKKN
jgi:hypothetical protein